MYKYLIVACCFLYSCKTNSQSQETKTEESKVFEITKSDSEWKSELSDMEFYVIREKGTERPHTGDLLNNKKSGTYTCRACELPLFDSDTKFESGTGWPSFYQPVDEEKVYTETDYKIGYPRSEVMCNRCGGHLGHVFKDGPQPTGLRYCINAVSLDFVEEEK